MGAIILFQLIFLIGAIGSIVLLKPKIIKNSLEVKNEYH